MRILYPERGSRCILPRIPGREAELPGVGTEAGIRFPERQKKLLRLSERQREPEDGSVSSRDLRTAKTDRAPVLVNDAF